MQLESVFFVLVVFIVENDFLDGGVFKVDDFAALRALEGARVERVLVHGQLKAAARALHGVEDGVVFVLVVVLFDPRRLRRSRSRGSHKTRFRARRDLR